MHTELASKTCSEDIHFIKMCLKNTENEDSEQNFMGSMLKKFKNQVWLMCEQ